MHRGQMPSPSDCRLTGACDGPMAALIALLSSHGILPASTATLPANEVRPVSALIYENLLGRFEPPDSPPPRA